MLAQSGSPRLALISATQSTFRSEGGFPVGGQTKSLRFFGSQLETEFRSHREYREQNEAEVPHTHTLQEHYRVAFRYVEKKKLSFVFEPGQS